MANHKKPSRSKIRKKNTLVSKNKRDVKKMTPDEIRRGILYHEYTQKDIDKYNNCDIYNINPFFRDQQLVDDTIIVRIFKEDWIKFKDVSNPDAPIYDCKFRQVDARERTSDRVQFINTPFPYLDKGVIVAISPTIKLKYEKMKKEMAEFDKEAAEQIKIPSVGDIIEIKTNGSSVWLKNNRYYIDKNDQCKDIVYSATDMQLAQFDHYYKFEYYDFVAIDDFNSKKGFFSDETIPDWYIKEKEYYDAEIEKMEKEMRKEIKLMRKKDVKDGEQNIVDTSTNETNLI
jgi:hypothetical protein